MPPTVPPTLPAHEIPNACRTHPAFRPCHILVRPLALLPRRGRRLAGLVRQRRAEHGLRRERAARVVRARQESPRGQGIDLETTRNVQWTARLGSQTYGNAVVSRGRLVIGTNDEDLDDARFESTRGGAAACFDEATGKLLWQLVDAAAAAGPQGHALRPAGPGRVPSPTVEGDRCYVVSNRGEVLCLDVQGMANGNDGPFTDEGHYTVGPGKPPVEPGPNDADILWRFDMIDAAAVLPARRRVLLDAGPRRLALRRHVATAWTGRTTRCPCPLAPQPDRARQADRPAGGRRRREDRHAAVPRPVVVALAGRGRRQDARSSSAAATASATPSRPVDGRVRQAVSPLEEGLVVRLQSARVQVQGRQADPLPRRRQAAPTAATRTTARSSARARSSPRPCSYNNRVYVAIGQDPAHGRGKGMLTCIDATKTGDITADRQGLVLRRASTAALSTVSIADGLLYVADVAGADPLPRRRHRQAPTGSTTRRPRSGAPTLVADGKVYLGTKKGLLVLAAGKEAKVLSEIHLGAPVYCTPVAANGTLYVASQRYLWAVQTSAGVPLPGTLAPTCPTTTVPAHGLCRLLRRPPCPANASSSPCCCCPSLPSPRRPSRRRCCC